MVVLGGTDIREDIFRLREPVHLVVATPGRVLDLIEKGLADVSKCRTVVFDEADKLLSMDFQGVLERLLVYFPANRQIMLFSATFPVSVDAFMRRFMRNPSQIK